MASQTKPNNLFNKSPNPSERRGAIQERAGGIFTALSYKGRITPQSDVSAALPPRYDGAIVSTLMRRHAGFH
jgi:hypothetical protein